jgi:hypothetical protein
MIAAPLILALALLQQPQPTPVQRPAEITISVEEYARLKQCEAEMARTPKKPQVARPLNFLIAAVAAIAIVAIARKKNEAAK